MDLTFHVIYTPGTVEVLAPLARSLVMRTSGRFRLVANGLPDAEAERLRALAGEHPRFAYHRHPSDEMAPHGVVLDALLAACGDPHFAFMDSDVYATGDFVAELAPVLARMRQPGPGAPVAVFSGVPIWASREDQVGAAAGKGFFGPHNRTDSGLPLGTSYFAVYRRAPLAALVGREGVSFHAGNSEDGVPPRFAERLAAIGALTRRYDTGKLLNLLLQLDGGALELVELATARHVGGLSLFERKHQDPAYRSALGPEPGDATRAASTRRPWLARKRRTCLNVAALLAPEAAAAAGAAPAGIEEDWLRARIAQVAAEIVQLRGEFGTPLRAADPGAAHPTANPSSQSASP